MKESIESRAVKIAARIMTAAGLCVYDSTAKCRKKFVDKEVCDKCIKKWLLLKSRQELRKDGQSNEV